MMHKEIKVNFDYNEIITVECYYSTPDENPDDNYHLERVYFECSFNGKHFKYDVDHHLDDYFYSPYESLFWSYMDGYIVSTIQQLNCAALNLALFSIHMPIFYAGKFKTNAALTTLINLLLTNGLYGQLIYGIKKEFKIKNGGFEKFANTVVGCIVSYDSTLLEQFEKHELYKIMNMLHKTHKTDYVVYIMEAIAAIDHRDGYDPMKKFEL